MSLFPLTGVVLPLLESTRWKMGRATARVWWEGVRGSPISSLTTRCGSGGGIRIESGDGNGLFVIVVLVEGIGSDDGVRSGIEVVSPSFCVSFS